LHLDRQDLHRAQGGWQCVAVAGVDLRCTVAVASAVAMVAVVDIAKL